MLTYQVFVLKTCIARAW